MLFGSKRTGEKMKEITTQLGKNQPTRNRKDISIRSVQDFSKLWTDENLYAKYELAEEEIAFIESMIKPIE